LNDQCNLLERHLLKELQFDNDALLWLQVFKRPAYLMVTFLAKEVAFRTLCRRKALSGLCPFL